MKLRATRLVALLAAVALPVAAADAAPPGDTTIDLPAGFAGEGVTLGAGNTFYAGSLADGRIAIGDVAAGTSTVWVDDPVVAPAVGLDADVGTGLLWVAGGPSGEAAVYDLASGDAVATLTLTAAPAFVNDVVVTGDAAWFTNSFAPELYRVPVSPSGEVGEPETVALSGPAGHVVPSAFNLNGIAATADGSTLVVVNSATGDLFTVDAATGDSEQIDLGGDNVAGGDGIALKGHWLYVLQNGAGGGDNQVAVIKLSGDLSSVERLYTVTSPLFETATTLDLRGSLIVAVNAQFAGAPIDDPMEVVLLRSF